MCCAFIDGVLSIMGPDPHVSPTPLGLALLYSNSLWFRVGVRCMDPTVVSGVVMRRRDWVEWGFCLLY